MEQGKVILIIISCSLMFLAAVPFVIRLIRQIIAVKKGTAYISDRVHNDNAGRLFVEWTDVNGEKQKKIFNVICRNYRSLTEVKIYSYGKIYSLGKMSVLYDILSIMLFVAASVHLSIVTLF